MFKIKRAFMKKILDKKKKNQPFNYEAAEAFSIDKDGDGSFNNSYYFSAHSAQKSQSLYTRLGLRDDGSAEVWVFFNEGEKQYSLSQMLYTAETSPLKVYKKDEQWFFDFEGKLTDDNGKEIKAKLNCAFSSDKPAVDFFYHMPSKRMATAMAQDKWGKNYFSEVQKNNSVHYEQEGLLTGKLTLGTKKIDVELPCLRDHSYGRRVWDYMNNHLWLAAVDTNFQLNFSMVSYPSISILEVGHLREGDGNVEFVTKAHYDRNLIVTGEIPHELQLELTINQHKKLNVNAELLSAKTYVFGDGAYTFYEGIANFTVNGQKKRGILEIGFNRDISRFMNGKNIKTIKE